MGISVHNNNLNQCDGLYMLGPGSGTIRCCRLVGVGVSLSFFFFFLLDIFFIYISNIIPFPGFSFENHLSHPPSPCFYEGVSPLFHPLPLPSLAFPYTGASSFQRTKGLSSPGCPTTVSFGGTYLIGAFFFSFFFFFFFFHFSSVCTS